MCVFYVLIGYFVITLIVFAVLDYYFEAKKNNVSVDELAFMSILWIFLLIGLIFAMPFYVIDKLIKRKNIWHLNAG